MQYQRYIHDPKESNGPRLFVEDELPFDPEKEYYLAGPMSGYPAYNFPAFEEACRKLRSVDLKIRSPHEIDYGETEKTRGSLDYETYMQAGLDLLNQCSGIILLNGWPQSGGACREVSLSIDLGLPMYFFNGDDLIGMNRRPPA
jgi:hypothetical protein